MKPTTCEHPNTESNGYAVWCEDCGKVLKGVNYDPEGIETEEGYVSMVDGW